VVAENTEVSVEKLCRDRKSKDSNDIKEEVEFEFTSNDDTGQEKKDDSSADQNHGDATRVNSHYYY
jgi:hypothetical protein